jgi:hypothetical protein
MRQQTLASQGSFEKFGRKGKQEIFLDQMNQVVPAGTNAGELPEVNPIRCSCEISHRDVSSASSLVAPLSPASAVAGETPSLSAKPACENFSF